MKTVYTSKKLPEGRWGIYNKMTLLATITCPQTCKDLIRTMNYQVNKGKCCDVVIAEEKEEVLLL